VPRRRRLTLTRAQLAAVFLFSAKLHALYFVAFAVVIAGLSLYHTTDLCGSAHQQWGSATEPERAPLA
jgi:hypothetical protein